MDYGYIGVHVVYLATRYDDLVPPPSEAAVYGIHAVTNCRYSSIVSNQHDHVDKPEPRCQALLAFLAVGTIYLALPPSLIVGPTWLLPTLIVVLLVPTVISHRTGKRSLNRVLGLIINGITTLALIAS